MNNIVAELRWRNPREEKPKHNQLVIFITSPASDSHAGDMYGGYFVEDPGCVTEGYIGTFNTGIPGTRGIGFHVWAQNKHEVSWWLPLSEIPFPISHS